MKDDIDFLAGIIIGIVILVLSGMVWYYARLYG